MNSVSPLAAESSDDASQPLVTVIIPTYNRAYCIKRSIRSVLAQTYSNLELIIVDDASTDNTEQVVGEIGDPRLKYICCPTNGGAAAARNLGLTIAKGEYIAFQDSDDEWLLEKLEKQVAIMDRLDDAYGATFGGKILYGRNADGVRGKYLSCYVPDGRRINEDNIRSTIVQNNAISPQTLMLRKSVIDEIGGFDERLPCNNDWEFNLRLSQHTQIDYCGEPLVTAFISDDSISQNTKYQIISLMIITKKHKHIFVHNKARLSRLYFRIGRKLQQYGRAKSAIPFIARAIKLHPWSIKYWAALSISLTTRSSRSAPSASTGVLQRPSQGEA